MANDYSNEANREEPAEIKDQENNIYVEEVSQPYNPYINPPPGYAYPVQDQPQPVIEPRRKLKKVLTGSGIGMFLMLVAMLSFVYVSTMGNASSGVATVAASKTASTVLYSATTNGSTGTSATTSTTTSNETSAVNTGGTLTVQQIVQKVTPAVVQITSQQTVTTRSNSRTGSTGTGTGSSTTQATGVGTGIIYDASGLILTNNHVVEGADSLLVTLTDGRSFQGTVVGTDSQTDLAVVKITADNLTVATLGDSSALQVGDGLVAIGNALALPGGPTVTTGVVSALNRSVEEPTDTSTTTNPFAQTQASTSGVQLYGLIQTDAAINPGNSGGPLINMNGEVVGINTLGAGEVEPGVQAEGIGFAISINQAKQIAQQLVENGSVSHAYLGVASEPLTAAIANQLGVNLTAGTVIDQVQSGSAAATAGLKAGDIVTAVDGTKLVGESDLGEIINSHQPGDKVTLTVVTPTSQGGSGAERSVEVTLGTQAANS
jgi:S1-C subfamily serine protease